MAVVYGLFVPALLPFLAVIHFVNTEDKHWETCMYTSFFKRELRTNSTLPMRRISKSISENKHRG